jgi:hypothetical protein
LCRGNAREKEGDGVHKRGEHLCQDDFVLLCAGCGVEIQVAHELVHDDDVIKRDDLRWYSIDERWGRGTAV